MTPHKQALTEEQWKVLSQIALTCGSGGSTLGEVPPSPCILATDAPLTSTGSAKTA